MQKSQDEKIEKILRDKGKTGPRLSTEIVESVVVGETYTVLPSGKVMICELTLRNGFTVRGESSCVSKSNFDEDIGRLVSRQKAIDTVWMLEAYMLQQALWKSEEWTRAIREDRDGGR